MHPLAARLRFAIFCGTMVVAPLVAAPKGAPQQAPQEPRAMVADVSHDFGNIEQGSKVVHQFVVRNAGGAALALTRVSLSQSGLSAKMRPSVPPGEQATLTIEWNTSTLKGPVEAKAVLEVNDPATPQITFVLTAVVKPALEFLPYPAVYASVFKGEPAQRTIRIVNNRERPLGISRMEPQGEHFHAAIAPVEPGRVYELAVTIPETVSPGRYSEAVFLYTDDPQLPRLMVPVNVIVKRDVYANPETIDFGRVSSKELSTKASSLELLTQTVMVRKRAGTFSIKAVTSDIAFVTTRRSPDGDADSDVFRIDVALVADRLRPGPIGGTVTIVTDDKEFPEIVVPVRGEIQ